MTKKNIAIIGAGPAGLIAAEVLAQKGYQVNIYDAMPMPARKFLRAGIGGLNITFNEPLESFLEKYTSRKKEISLLLQQFSPDDLLSWVHDLGIETFIGTSGRVFPKDKKASPLLRAWLQRLKSLDVQFHQRYKWIGFTDNNTLKFQTPECEVKINADAVLLALGGGSWPQLGSDASWVSVLQKNKIHINPLKPSNCGFSVNWSEYFTDRFEGSPIKNVKATIKNYTKQGDLLISKTGIQGGLMYALSSMARDQLEHESTATLYIDLCPQWNPKQIFEKLYQPRGKNTLTKHLKNKLGLSSVKSNLIYECLDKNTLQDYSQLADKLKAIPIELIAANPIEEAISTAGGIAFSELNESQMLYKLPGVFCAGEMLDWEAPTGGYLLSAVFASGFVAGHGIAKWLESI